MAAKEEGPVPYYGEEISFYSVVEGRRRRNTFSLRGDLRRITR